MLLEKAWAKVHGSYTRTEGGLPSHASQHLSGMPAVCYSHSDYKNNSDKFWRILKKHDNQKMMMMCSSNSGTNDQFSAGIVLGHAYTLLSCHEVDAHGQQWKLLKVRNPWGSKEWEGEWSDGHEYWTPELDEELGHTDANDGIFFIPFENYLQQFARTSACFTRGSGYQESEAEVYRGDRTKYLTFTLKQNQDTIMVTAN